MTSVAALLEGRRICICGGSGGVGKTTTSASIAAGMALRGFRVVVVTIDPARRLADSLGLEELGNEPHQVDPARLAAAAGVEPAGELWALMLDPKRTFDELIDRLAPTPQARDEVLSNRIYQELSNAVAGSQEFSAIAKLHELDREDGFDLIVLDTPPSRNALDFLDAPDRLTQFFEGRALGVLLRPAGLATRIVGRGTGLVSSVLQRVTGVDLLTDLSVFFRALSGMIEGFRERAAQVKALLSDPGTTFLLITSPEPEPVEEAIFFWRRLVAARMPFGGLVVNRVHPALPAGTDPADVATELRDELGPALAGRVAENFRDFRLLAERDRRSIDRLVEAIGGAEVVEVPLLDEDVHDVAGLLRLHPHLFGEDGATA